MTARGEWAEFKARGEYWGAILPKSALERPVFEERDMLISLLAENTVSARAARGLSAL